MDSLGVDRGTVGHIRIATRHTETSELASPDTSSMNNRVFMSC